ncbi:MAG: hypothetical protein RIF41_36120 [Polyangiaceae bacterium]
MNRTTILLVVALASCGCRRLPTPAPVATASEPRHEATLRAPRQPPGWMWPVAPRARPTPPPPTRYPPSHAARHRLTAPR